MPHQAIVMCCKDLTPSNAMLSYFNSSVHIKTQRPEDAGDEVEGRAEGGGAGGTPADG